MRNILVPTDFSENANDALLYAIELAKEFNSTLHVVNSYKIPYSSTTITSTLKEIMKKDSIEGVEKTIEKINFLGFDSAKVVSKSFSGDLIQVITPYINENSIDIVVMGTKGASGIEEVLIGSTAESVVRHVPVPVLIIPSKVKFTSLNTIGLAADFQKEINKNDLQPYLNIAKQYGAKTLIINVDDKEENILSTDKAVHGIKLDHLFGDLPHTFHYEMNDDIVEGLNNFVQKFNCQMLVLLARKHNLFEKVFHKSITNSLTCHSEIPTFVIKEG